MMRFKVWAMRVVAVALAVSDSAGTVVRAADHGMSTAPQPANELKIDAGQIDIGELAAGLDRERWLAWRSFCPERSGQFYCSAS